jgi:hypothetical protein
MSSLARFRSTLQILTHEHTHRHALHAVVNARGGQHQPTTHSPWHVVKWADQVEVSDAGHITDRPTNDRRVDRSPTDVVRTGNCPEVFAVVVVQKLNVGHRRPSWVWVFNDGAEPGWRCPSSAAPTLHDDDHHHHHHHRDQHHVTVQVMNCPGKRQPRAAPAHAHATRNKGQ